MDFLGAINGLIDFIKKPLTVILGFITFIANPIFAVISLVMGCIADPGGAINAFLCRVIDVVAYPFPTSPDNIKLVNLITAMGNSIPILGSGIIFDFAQTFVAIMVIFLGVKIYKLLPFKMS